jgi:glutamyl-tRNA synthetase
VRSRLEREAGAWEEHDLTRMLRAENAALGLRPQVFMTALRHALSGMKTGPSVPVILALLDLERSLRRLALDGEAAG